MEKSAQPIIQACYVNGKTCRNGKRDDFDTNPLTGEKFVCSKWVRLQGTDPQTGNQIETWCCNEFAKIKLALEQSNMTRHNIASTDKVANEIRSHHLTFYGALNDESRTRLIERNEHPKVEMIEQQNLLGEKNG